jgi:hypothetical protein
MLKFAGYNFPAVRVDPVHGNSEETPNNLNKESLGSDKNWGRIKGVETTKKTIIGKNDFKTCES